ncbi:MAG: nucleoside-triphosphatase [Dehalococcoidia bacterium]
MVIVITGAIGVGKTTVCEKVIKIARTLGYSCGGILTHKAAHESLIALDIQTGQTSILASTDNMFDGPTTPRYSFNPAAIKFAIRAINKAIDSDVLVVDELGHLELAGEGFAKGLELVKTGKVKNSILVIRKELLPAFLAQLDDTPSVFEVSLRTRDRLPREICSSLIGDTPDSTQHVCID